MSGPHQKVYMSAIREMLECARAFEHYSAAHVRTLGLTGAQFDIIATLGNTKGMSCKELGEKTLITKGTMTGVLDRLEAKGLLERRPSPEDGRSWITALTAEGQALFERVFPAHIAYVDPVFAGFEEAELRALKAELAKVRAAFVAASAAAAPATADMETCHAD